MGVFTLKPKGSYTQRNQDKSQPAQSCSCKPNADGRRDANKILFSEA